MPLIGGLTHLPVLGAKDSADLAEGLPLVVARYGNGGASRTYLIRRVVHDPARIEGLLVGEIDADYLWATSDQSLISSGTVLTVRDDRGRALMSSIAGAHTAFQTLGLDARSEADSLLLHAPEAYVSSEWPILLDEVFAAPTWTLVLGRSRADVLGPVQRFTQTLLGIVLISTGLVLILSMHRIRRSLVPMASCSRAPVASRGGTSAAGSLFEAATSSRSSGPRSTPWRPSSTASSRRCHGRRDRPGGAFRDHAGEIVGHAARRLPDVYPCARWASR